MRSLSRNSNDSGVPQWLQKPRRAIFDEAKYVGSTSHCTSLLRRLRYVARVLPKANWHMRNGSSSRRDVGRGAVAHLAA